MANEFRKYDEHGFPVAPRFEDLKYQDDEPPRKLRFSINAKRWVVLVLVVGIIVPVIFGPQIVSAGRDILAGWYRSRAEQKYLDRDYPGAVADLSCAIRFDPDDIELRLLRANWRQRKQNDLEGSLSDLNDAIRMIETARNLPHGQIPQADVGNAVLARAYVDRGWVYVRLKRGREAIDDCNKAVELTPLPENLNARAYSRAVLNVELNDALVDVDKALDSGNRDNPNYQDTRGYLLHLLNRNQDALEELNKAIGGIQRLQRRLGRLVQLPGLRLINIDGDELDHALAVMYRHRGLVNEKMGNKSQAERDFSESALRGYNPEQGVF